ncbi:hypothetical protein A7P54_06200 [Acinetobacter sp. Ac_3412]|uniref:ETX/MTX2 family pore-forming toxin n=1 Tax=Acinetobacter sp. Ac_3412 TaxID=1848935 RepID=UPI00148FD385|nr:ETX/MTX2 family pore-forming toxin [Acinetobacter sp. Ac_3412]NNP76016.1 hypothetical protein [Acinetobacter sp. Ac_3412]
MSVKHLDKLYLRSLLTDFWKKELNTNKDPANGKWYEKGTQNDGGLYGDVSDADDVEIIFHQDQAKLEKNQVTIIHSDFDNSKSNIGTEFSTELSDTCTLAKTHTTTKSHTIKFGLGYEVKAKAGIVFVDVEETIKVNFEYQYATSKTESTTESSSQTIKQTIKCIVPAGKIYRASLVCTKQRLLIPFTALIAFKGTTGTWFESRVDNHYHWISSIGHAFQQINAKKLAGNDSERFTVRGIEDKGMMDNSQQFDFKIIISDITDLVNLGNVEKLIEKEENFVELVELA